MKAIHRSGSIIVKGEVEAKFIILYKTGYQVQEGEQKVYMRV